MTVQFGRQKVYDRALLLLKRQTQNVIGLTAATTSKDWSCIYQEKKRISFGYKLTD